MTWTDEEIDRYLAECWEVLEAAQDDLEEVYGLGHYARWDYRQSDCTVVFSGDTDIVLTFDAAAIGSLANGSWMWAWANDSLLPEFTADSRKLLDLAEESGMEPLSIPQWDADEEDAWTAAAVALRYLGGVGVYRCPIGPAQLFILLRERHRA